jgi:cyanophycinase-like exopeptidase
VPEKTDLVVYDKDGNIKIIGTAVVDIVNGETSITGIVTDPYFFKFMTSSDLEVSINNADIPPIR